MREILAILKAALSGEESAEHCLHQADSSPIKLARNDKSAVMSMFWTWASSEDSPDPSKTATLA